MNDLIAVYPTRARAHQVARSALEAGASAKDIQIANKDDESIALEEAVKHEMDGSTMIPPAVVAPPEMSKGFATAIVPGILLGAIFGFFIGLFFTWASDNNWSYLATTTAVGAFAGLVSAAMIGAHAGAEKATHKQLAPEKGVTISIHEPSEEVIEIIEASRPIQLDRVNSL